MAYPVGGELNQSFTKGQRTMASIQAQRKVPQYIKEIEINANAVPFLVLTEKLGAKHTVKGPTYFHTERDWNPIVVDDAGFGATTVATSWSVLPGHGARLTIGKMLKVLRTGEYIRVTAVSSGTGANVNGVPSDVITITRNVGGSSVGTIVAGEEVNIIGFADTEGNSSPDAQSSEPVIKTNAVQTFRQAYALSGRDIGAEVFGTAETKRIQQDAADDLYRQIEQSFLFSPGSQLSEPYVTAGVEGLVSTNVQNLLGNALTETTLYDNFIRPFFRRNYGQKDLYVFCGELPRKALDGFGLNNIRYKTDDEEIGIDVSYYNTSFGRLRLISHGLMTLTGGSISAASNGRAGYMFGVNMSKVGQAVFKGRDTALLSNRQLPDVDGKKWEFLSDKGFWLGSELQQAIIKGIGG